LGPRERWRCCSAQARARSCSLTKSPPVPPGSRPTCATVQRCCPRWVRNGEYQGLTIDLGRLYKGLYSAEVARGGIRTLVSEVASPP